jgi:glycerophosphoryl diester phosphodiesterase
VPEESTPSHQPLRLAHRGDWRHGPENSLAAILAAVAIPACDGLEFDVQLSADGDPVLLHDLTLERVLGRPERPDQLSTAALEALGLPTLAEVLAAVPRRMFLDVELKGDLGRPVVEVLAAGRGADLNNALVSSFLPSALDRIAGLAPGWPRWLNARTLEPTTIDLAVELGCTGISAQWRAIDPDGAARVRDAGLDLAAWTVRRRSTFDRLARLGVVAVCVEAAALDG